MIETARKEDLFLDKKLIIPENKLDAIRIMARLHPVVGDQPTHEKDQPNTNNPILDLACTIANIHEMGIGVHADLRKIQNEPPEYYFGKGFMSGISSLKGNGILAVFGQWHDASGKYAIKQFYYTDKEISYRNALDAKTWSGWIDILTSNSSLDYNKILNVPITSTLSDDKTKIASIFAVNNVNRTATNAQKTANTANANAVDAMNEALKKMDKDTMGWGASSMPIFYPKDYKEINVNGFYRMFGNFGHFHYGSALNMQYGSSHNTLFGVKSVSSEIPDFIAVHNNGSNNEDVVIGFLTTGNTTTSKGFLRFNGNLIPLTEDQLTSSLGDYRDRAASIYIVNQVNRDVVIAQKTANAADAKANKAQQTADQAQKEVIKRVLPQNVKSESLKDRGSYWPGNTAPPIFIGGEHGLCMSDKFIINNPGLDFSEHTNEFLHFYIQANYVDGNLVGFFNGYNSNRFYIATKRNNENWSKPSLFHSTENTTHDPSGFLRSFGNAIALTTDKLTSDLKVNRSDLIASAKYAYDVYQATLSADKKAVTAQARADAAFSRIKPISEGGTGATTAANARKNLGIQTTNVLVVTGTIAHGGTIPIPSGFSVNECSFFVSTDKMNPEEEKWDIQETSKQMHFKSECFVSNRVVTCRMWVGTHYGPTHATDPSRWINGIANYIVIGVKK